jgi:hypothetical protein
MRRPPFEREPPAGFEVQCSPGGCIAIHGAASAELRARGFGLDGDGDAAPSDLAGRAPLLELRCGGTRLLLRRYTHGGLLRWLTGSRFGDPRRPFRELALAEDLRARGILTPRVIAARARRAGGFGWRLDLISERVEGAVDLTRALFDAGTAARRRPLLEAAGRTVGELHRHGVLHADLTPRNLLVQRTLARGEPARLWVIDLDRTRRRASLTRGEREDNLRRLFRHVERMRLEHGLRLGRAELARFLRAWAAACGEPWKPAWRAIHRKHRRTARWHGLGWLLEHLGSQRRDLPGI